jgi:hypothetical protein
MEAKQMFEGPKEDKELELHKGWIALFIVIAVVIAVVAFRALNKGPAKGNVQASVADLSKADPIKDLKIERANMQKDSLGTTAVWLVTLTNKSNTFTYTDITYQTDYIAADNHLLVENHGTVSGTIGPNVEHSAEIRDTAYPDGTAWFKFKITGAKAKVVE